MPLLHARVGNIQNVMFINLPKRIDRRRLIVGELGSLEVAPESIIRIEAVDAANCDETPLECCARSHIAALGDAILRNLDAVLIREGDFQLIHSPRHTRDVGRSFSRRCLTLTLYRGLTIVCGPGAGMGLDMSACGICRLPQRMSFGNPPCIGCVTYMSTHWCTIALSTSM